VGESVIIVSLPTYGGSGVVAAELGVALARRKWDVHFVSTAPPVRLALYAADTRISERIHFHQVTSPAYAMFHHQPYVLSLAVKIAQVARHCKAPIIHAHYAIPHTIAAHLAREMLDGKACVITTLHGTDITLVGLDPSYRDIVTYALKVSDGVTAVSQFLLRATREEFPYAGPIEVIPNFVAPEVFHPHQPQAAAIRQRFAPDDRALLVHVSNYRPVKRAPAAVEVFGRVLTELPAHLLMIGEGPDRGLAEECAHSLGVGAHVSFLDNTLQLPPYLAAADLMLLPSESESFGLAALEAMACGTPVVASAIGGLPEVIDDGQDGILLPPQDLAGMAQAVLELLQDRERLQEMSRAAAAKPGARFPPQELVERYAALYRRTSQCRAESRNGPARAPAPPEEGS